MTKVSGLPDVTAVNVELCEALGLNPSNVSDVTISIRAGHFPKVTLTASVADQETVDKLRLVFRKYELTLKSEEPLHDGLGGV